MKYVYILESQAFAGRHYTGLTDDLRQRLKRHNAGEVNSTARYVPWQLRTYVAFDTESKAVAFERYLKTPSGRAFAKKRL
jgi:putative endonuclease